MRVISPFGEFPFSFSRIERRGSDVVLLGTMVGIESGLVLERRDLAKLGGGAAATAALIAAAIVLNRRP
jgi:hypothetical protein